MANSGMSLPLLKIAGGWKSSTVAEGYVAQSELTKRTIADHIILEGDQQDENSAPPNKRIRSEAFPTAAPPFQRT